jgi:hypothetical protein
MKAGAKITRRELLVASFSVVGLSNLVPLLLCDTVRAAEKSSLTESQLALLGAVAETIIPATDTPGALGAGVLDFLDMIVGRWLHEEERERFLRGLAEFDTTVRRARGRPFTALSSQEQLTLLTHMAAEETEQATNRPPGTGPFIAQMKALTIFGYYTSESGAAEELQFNLIPGRYEPCSHLVPGEHAPSISRSTFVLRLP